jgi:hypothetical protein
MRRSKLTVVDIAILIAAAVLCICFLASGWLLAVMYPLTVGVALVQWNQLYVSRKRYSHTLPAMAKVVDYHVETQRRRSRYLPTEVYQVWQPIVEFETERGTVKAEYPIFDRDHWFDFDTEYEIQYCPEQPEYFYFVSRRDEIVNEAEGGLLVVGIIAAAYTVALLVCYMNT